jgi:flagellar hook-associated protein 3 FlgL
MRVTFNTYSDLLLPQLNQQGTATAKLQAQISSGQNVSQASDDPQTAQHILDLQNQGAQMQQFYQNSSTALTLNESTYSAVDGLRQVADRASQISLKGNSLTAPGAFDSYGAEVNQLIEQAMTSANQKLNGNALLGGTKTDAAPFTATRDSSGNITAVNYVGAATAPAIPVDASTSITPQTDGTTNQGFADFMNQLVSLRDALQNHDPTAVTTAGTAIGTSDDSMVNTLGGLGAQQSRLQALQDSYTTQFTDLSSRISSYNDVDITQAAVQLSKSQTAYQASIQAAAKIMSHSLLDYLN